MRIKPLVLSIILLSLSISVFAQKPDTKTSEPVKAAKLPTVKEVLDKYVKALGGREAIEKIKSRTSTGTIEFVPMNLKGTFEAYAAPEGKSLTKMNVAGIGEMLEGSDGKTAWAVNPIQGNREKSGIELLQAKLLNDFYRDLRLEKLFPKMELKAIEKIDGRDTYVVSATADGVPEEKWYFDTQTGLMVRSDLNAVTPEGSQVLVSYYEDMRKVDGILIPFRIRSVTPQFTIVIASTEVKHGTQIDDAKFARPKQ